MHFGISRRDWLRAAAVGSAAGLPAWFLEEQSHAEPKSLGPNDTPGIALIGCGGRGRGVAREAAEFGRMVAICDVDEASIGQAKKIWPDAASFDDFRKVLDR